MEKETAQAKLRNQLSPIYGNKSINVEDYVDTWIKSHAPDTFIESDDKIEGYWYTSKNGQTSLNLKIYFVDLLEDFIEEWSSESKNIIAPTDEEIDAKFPSRNSSGTYLDTNVGRREGAKWMRDRRNKSPISAIGLSNLKASLLEQYIRDKHTQEECTGFIDGFEAGIGVKNRTTTENKLIGGRCQEGCEDLEGHDFCAHCGCKM